MRKTTTRERTSQPLEDPLFCQLYGFTRDDDLLRGEIWTDPKLEERYEVVAGEVTFHVDGKPRRAGRGERVVLPAGVRHAFENTGQEIAHLVVEADPALELRESIWRARRRVEGRVTQWES